jgi:hypothetical protein
VLLEKTAGRGRLRASSTMATTRVKVATQFCGQNAHRREVCIGRSI